MKTAYAYARFSSDNQREESIDAQFRAIREYAKENEIQIVREFRDEGYSARTDKRPAFQEMFQLIQERPIDYLIVHKFDRFARNRYDSAVYKRKLRECGIRIISVLEHLDDSPESIIMEGIYDAMSEYYSANLGREVRKGMKENILNGKRNGGPPPKGYRIENQHLVPNDDAEKVRKVFAMYAAGEPYRNIIAYSGWSMTNVHFVLSNEVYRGVIKSGDIRYEGAHEPLIDEGTWQTCRQRMAESANNAANRAKSEYLLSGIVYCEKCGKKMTASKAGKYRYYTCRTKGCKARNADVLEKSVIDQIAEQIRPTDDLKARFYDDVKRRVNSRLNVDAVKRANQTVTQRINKLTDALEYAESPEETKTIMEKINELRSMIKPIPQPFEVSREECDAFVDSLGGFVSQTKTQQKAMIKMFIKKVIVGDKITVCLPISKRGYSIAYTK